MKWKCVVLGLAGVFGVLLSAWGQGGAAGQQFPLQKGDGILVRVSGIGEGLPAYREVVDDKGEIEVPYVGLLRVEGLTPKQTAERMQFEYVGSGLTTNPVVDILYVTHFEPPPSRENLKRNADPRQLNPADVLDGGGTTEVEAGVFLPVEQ